MKGNTTIDLTEIKRVIREYSERLYDYGLDEWTNA